MASKQFKELSKGSDQNSLADLCRLGKQGKWKRESLLHKESHSSKERVCPHSGGDCPLGTVPEMKSAGSWVCGGGGVWAEEDSGRGSAAR